MGADRFGHQTVQHRDQRDPHEEGEGGDRRAAGCDRAAAGEHMGALGEQLHEGHVQHHARREAEAACQHLRVRAPTEHSECGADAGGTTGDEGEEEGGEHEDDTSRPGLVVGSGAAEPTNRARQSR